MAQVNGGRKQVLPLKLKNNSYVQQLDYKAKEPLSNAPVTMLALKRKEKSDKNVVVQLAYRKPNVVNGSTSSMSSSSTAADQNHMNMLMGHHLEMNSQSRRPGSPSSSGYDTDSLLEQENSDVFSSLLNSSFGYNPSGMHMMHHHHHHHHHHHDLLHSHPIWSPQPSSSNNGLLMAGSPLNYFIEQDNKNKFLIQ